MSTRGRLALSLGIVFALGLGVLGIAWAQEPAAQATETSAAVQLVPVSAVNAGDTAWVLAATALVLLMTAPGLALFYGGLVGQRNVLSTLMHSFFLACLISVQWVVFGYSLAFGSGRLVGGLDFLLFRAVGQEPLSGQTIPHLAFDKSQSLRHAGHLQQEKLRRLTTASLGVIIEWRG